MKSAIQAPYKTRFARSLLVGLTAMDLADTSSVGMGQENGQTRHGPVLLGLWHGQQKPKLCLLEQPLVIVGTRMTQMVIW